MPLFRYAIRAFAAFRYYMLHAAFDTYACHATAAAALSPPCFFAASFAAAFVVTLLYAVVYAFATLPCLMFSFDAAFSP